MSRFDDRCAGSLPHFGAVLSLVGILGLATESFAQSDGPWSFSVTPRVGYKIFDTSADLSPPVPGVVTSVDAFTGTEFGGTIQVKNTEFLSRTDFLFTGLYTPNFTADSKTSVVGPNGLPTTVDGEVDLTRTDLELIARTFFTSQAYWFAGFQYIRTNFETDSSNPLTREFNSEVTSQVFLPKAGLGGLLPLDPPDADDPDHSPRQFFFANFALGVGYNPIKVQPKTSNPEMNDEISVDGGFVGTDLNIGYAYLFSDRFSFDLRYRAQLGNSFGHDSPVNDGFFSVHGPEVGFTIRF